MKLPLGFGDLDFTDWGRGIAAAFIGGGAGAVSAGFSVSAIDPDHFQMGGANFFKVACATFCISGFLNMMAFLRTKPIPELKKVVTTAQTTSTTGPEPDRTVVTVQETKMVPVDEPTRKP